MHQQDRRCPYSAHSWRDVLPSSTLSANANKRELKMLVSTPLTPGIQAAKHSCLRSKRCRRDCKQDGIRSANLSTGDGGSVEGANGRPKRGPQHGSLGSHRRLGLLHGSQLLLQRSNLLQQPAKHVSDTIQHCTRVLLSTLEAQLRQKVEELHKH